MDRVISRQELEQACRVLRKPRKSASVRALADACGLPGDATKVVLRVIQSQPFTISIRNEKGTWLSYGWTNYAQGLIHMSFCAVVCEGHIVEGSESPAAPMFDGPTQLQLREKYQALAKENNWAYLDVAHDHMTHLLDELEAAFKA